MGFGTKDIETKRGNMSCESIVSCLVLLLVDEQNCLLTCCLICLILLCIIILQAVVSGIRCWREKSISYLG